MTPAGWAFATLMLIGATLSPAAEAADDGLARCAKLEKTDERLACYDELAKRPSAAELPSEPEDGSFLARTWKLGPADDAARRIADILSYRPNFVDAHWTDGTNVRPRSPSTGRAVPEDFDRGEVKLQASFKTELISRAAFDRTGVTPLLSNFGVHSVRLWFGYTQNMHWQAFNHGQARPIRDANYEPEAIVTLGTGNTGDGFKLVNLGVSHQSNGLDPREHRGWSRLYLQGGWEWERFSVLARLWRIVPQSDDDNPNIKDFYGHGDLVARYQSARGVVTEVLLRGNTATGLGFVQLDAASPPLRAAGNLKLHVQLTSGYGETLIDYNFRQRTIGVGISFGDW